MIRNRTIPTWDSIYHRTCTDSSGGHRRRREGFRPCTWRTCRPAASACRLSTSRGFFWVACSHEHHDSRLRTVSNEEESDLVDKSEETDQQTRIVIKKRKRLTNRIKSAPAFGYCSPSAIEMNTVVVVVVFSRSKTGRGHRNSSSYCSNYETNLNARRRRNEIKRRRRKRIVLDAAAHCSLPMEWINNVPKNNSHLR